MNNKLLPLLFVASSVFAQTSPVAPFSKAHPVASPNRTILNDGAASKVGGVSRDDGLEKPIRLVDSKGVTLGRFIETSFAPKVLLTYNGQPMVLQVSQDLNAQNFPASGGFTWNASVLYYPSADCSGTAYAYSGTAFGTRYVGWTARVNGIVYINVADVKLSAVMSFNSVYDDLAGSCFFFQSDTFLAPIIATAPAAPLGTTPFFLK